MTLVIKDISHGEYKAFNQVENIVLLNAPHHLNLEYTLQFTSEPKDSIMISELGDNRIVKRNLIVPINPFNSYETPIRKWLWQDKILEAILPFD